MESGVNGSLHVPTEFDFVRRKQRYPSVVEDVVKLPRENVDVLPTLIACWEGKSGIYTL